MLAVGMSGEKALLCFSGDRFLADSKVVESDPTRRQRDLRQSLSRWLLLKDWTNHLSPARPIDDEVRQPW
jgi:hypothetical protein